MRDPNYSIQVALIKTISDANVTLNDVAVPVYAYVPPGTPTPYILLDQVSTVPQNGARACADWESIFQLTVVTSFKNVGDDTASLVVQEQLVELLHEQPLILSGDFQLNSMRVDLTTKTSSYDNNTLFILRYIRLKLRVFQDK